MWWNIYHYSWLRHPKNTHTHPLDTPENELRNSFHEYTDVRYFIRWLDHHEHSFFRHVLRPTEKEKIEGGGLFEEKVRRVDDKRVPFGWFDTSVRLWLNVSYFSRSI